MNAPSFKRAQRYASVIIRWLVVGAVVFGLTLYAGYYITNDVMPKVYTASATVQLPASDLATPMSTNLAPVALQPEFVNTMMSPQLLLSVIKDLALDKEWAKRLYKTNADEVPDVDALTRMEKLVKVEVLRGTNNVLITAASDVPQEAADIANAIATRYQTLCDSRTDMDPVIGAAFTEQQRNRVRIIERAVIPIAPTMPNKGFNFAVTIVAACVLSLLVASFLEMILLFVRAGERAEG